MNYFPAIPRPAQIWRSLSFWINLAYLLLILQAVPKIIVNYWFLKNLGLQNVFWTNFSIHVILFVICFVLFTLVIYLPFRLFATTPALRRGSIQIGLWIGIFAGWMLSLFYKKFLLAFHAVSFGEQDPVFGKDISFYVFSLPAIRIILTLLTVLAVTGPRLFLVARSPSCAKIQLHDHQSSECVSVDPGFVTDGENLFQPLWPAV
jgi:uncharacterized membrane protein (UPF0182 family)